LKRAFEIFFEGLSRTPGFSDLAFTALPLHPWPTIRIVEPRIPLLLQFGRERHLRWLGSGKTPLPF